MMTYKLTRKSSTQEWVVRAYRNGKKYPEADYYTDDKQDAIDTMALMSKLPEVYHASWDGLRTLTIEGHEDVLPVPSLREVFNRYGFEKFIFSASKIENPTVVFTQSEYQMSLTLMMFDCGNQHPRICKEWLHELFGCYPPFIYLKKEE